VKAEAYRYRGVTEADLPALKALGVLSYGRFRSGMAPDQWEKLRTSLSSDETWRALLRQSRGYICTFGGLPIGMAFLVSSGNPTELFSADWAYIRLVGVDPAHENKGIARNLTMQCINQAREDKESVVALHTSEVMVAARHLYESLGFKILKEIDPRFGKRYWIYTLSLK
jgi:ribosomal protein S18 acetylase RimI-like enzyme